MGGDSAGQRDRQMAALMDRGFNMAQSMQLSAWTAQRKPPTARYSAAQFDPGASFAEAYRPPATVAKADAPTTQKPAVTPKYAGFVAPAPATPTTVPATAAVPVPNDNTPSLGTWVIQVGSFNEPQAAQMALQRASSALPATTSKSASVTVDEVQMANRTFHRARLTNLSQEQAVDGCKQLEKKKIYCSALQITSWNTPSAR